MRRFTLAAMMLAAIAAQACSRQLLVGVVVPETGDAAVYGTSVKMGIELAFDEALADGTAPEGLAVKYFDSQSDPAQAAALAESLYREGALAVIGGVTSAEAKAMIPVADSRKRILMSPSASAPELARMSMFFFRMYPSDDLEGVKAADLLTINRGVRTVLVLQEDNPYTRGLLPVFMAALKNQGAELLGSVHLNQSGWEREFRDLLTSRQPEGLYICGYGPAIVNALREVRAADFRGTVATTSAINSAPILEEAGDLAEGVFFPLVTVDFSSDEEPIATFVRRFQETYGVPPDIYAAHGYDAALAVMKATHNLRTRSGGEIQVRLKGLGDDVGVTGYLAFDDFGNIKHYLRNFWIYEGQVDDFDARVERQKEEVLDRMRSLLEGR